MCQRIAAYNAHRRITYRRIDNMLVGAAHDERLLVHQLVFLFQIVSLEVLLVLIGTIVFNLNETIVAIKER